MLELSSLAEFFFASIFTQAYGSILLANMVATLLPIVSMAVYVSHLLYMKNMEKEFVASFSTEPKMVENDDSGVLILAPVMCNPTPQVSNVRIRKCKNGAILLTCVVVHDFKERKVSTFISPRHVATKQPIEEVIVKDILSLA